MAARNDSSILSDDSDETIIGDAFANTLLGLGGNDYIQGRGGIDTLEGGEDNDRLEGGADADVLDGGNGFDSAVYYYATAGVTADLQTPGNNLGDAQGDSYTSIEGLIGSVDHADTLSGDSGANAIAGLGGNDAINGRAGNDNLQGMDGDDTLDGGAGVDILSGGGGIDSASYASSASGVVASLADRTQNTGDGAGDFYASIEGLGGSENADTLIGDNAANPLKGMGGNDYLQARGGADTVEGGEGDDRLEGGADADVLNGGNGNDSAVYYYAAAGVTADLQMAGNNLGEAQGDSYASIEGLVGTLNHADTLSGDGAANAIAGLGGNDAINGRGGNDRLQGMDGDDTLDGGAGGDILSGDGGIDAASYASSAVGVVASLADRAQNTGDAAGDVYGSIEGLVGSENADTLIGDNAANALKGMGGNDYLQARGGADAVEGGEGDDRLEGGAGADVLNGGNGFDSAGYYYAAAGVTADLQTPGSNLGEAQGDTYNSIEGLVGTLNHGDTLSGDGAVNAIAGLGGNDTINGRGGDDFIGGMDGDDVIEGGAGADTMTGGNGLDLFRFNAAGGASDSTAIAMDTLTDFQQGQDRIDLRPLLGGYNPGTGADSSHLAWGGTAAIANGVWYEHAAGDTLVYADVNGNAAAPELAVRLTGIHQLDLADFLGVSAFVPEDQSLTFSTANFNALSVSDAQGDPLTITLTATHGALVLADTTGVTVVDGAGLDGTLTISGSIAALNAALGAGLTFTPTPDYSGAATLQIDADDGGAVTSRVFDISVRPVADTPLLGVTPATGDPDVEIPLSISASATDTDGSETLSISIEGVPSGAVLNAGVEDEGVWTLTLADLTGLTITSAPGSAEDFDLVVTVTATDGTSTATTQDTLHITVNDPFVGQAIDGYVVGATVFADTDEDGVLDPGEAHTTTGSNGLFTLYGGVGPLVMIGGTDISTGLAFTGTLRAPEGSTVITPLTTLVAALIEGTPGTSVADAQAQVITAFGLPDIDLTTFDPVQAALSGDPDAVEIYSAGVQVQNTISLAASLIDGAGSTGYDAAAAAVIGALANTISTSGGPVDLGNATTATDLIVTSAAAAGVTGNNIDNTAAAAANVVAEINTQVADAVSAGGSAALTQIAQTAVVAQDPQNGATAALADAGSSGDASTAQTQFTGANLEQAVDDAADDVGVIAGTIYGTAGNDMFTGGAGVDAYDGLAGNDSINGADNGDYLFGGDGNDNLTGGNGNDELRGGAQDDTLNGGTGNDLLDGGTTPGIQPGNTGDGDTANYTYAGAAGVVVNLASAANATYGIAGQTAVVGGSANDTDTLRNIEVIIGTSGADIIIGGGNPFNERFDGRAGNDTLVGGGAPLSEAFYTNAPSGIIVNLGTTAYDAGGGITVDAGTARDGYGTIDTLIDMNAVRGSSSGDVLIGNAADNRLRGENGADILDGGDGADEADFRSASTSGVVANLSSATVAFNLGSGTNTTAAAGTARDGYNVAGGGNIDTLISIENLRGTSFRDALVGDAGDNRLRGEANNDTLVGGAGNDVLNGGENAAGSLPDTDTISYIDSTSAVVVNLATHTASDGLGGTDTLVNVERVIGTHFADTLTGGDANNNHPSDSEVFAGRGGVDTIDGGTGNDWAEYRDAAAGVVVDIAAGTASNDGDGASDVLISIERVRGSAFADTIFGSDTTSGNERFEGMAGDDTIDGRGGLDYVMYTNSPSAVTVTFNGDGSGTATGGHGSDTFFGIEGVRGSNSADVLTGSNRTDSIEYFEGFGGNDTIHGNGGIDRIEYSQSGSGVTVNLVAGTATGGAGNDTFTGIEQIMGSRFNDILTGDTGPNRIDGSDGNDTIQGGEGDDVLLGGAGDDSINGSFGVDTIDGGAGSDTLNRSGATTVQVINFVTGTNGGDTFVNMENATTSAFDDTLIGNGIANRLNGGAGNDLIVGGAGDDTLDGGENAAGALPDNDALDYSGSTSPVNVNLATGIATDGLGGTDRISNIERVIGTAGNDVLTGGDATNNDPQGSENFQGRGGNDLIDGGIGNDWAEYTNAAAGIVGDLAAGTVSNDGDGGQDTLVSVERLRGSAHDDTMFGSDTTSGNERFEGNAGNDTIDGRGGIDHLHFVSAPAGINITLGIDGSGTAADGYGTIDTFSGIEGVRGSAFADTITGSDRTDVTEIFEGSGGDDIIDGQGGRDRAEYQQALSGIVVNLGMSTATDGRGGTDTLLGIEEVTGSRFNDVIIGGGGDDRLLGMNGDDTLNGGAGADVIDGGGGIDTLDRSGGTGPQVVNLVTGTNGADVVLNIENVLGSAHADTIIGNGFVNRLEGRAGDDLLWGGDGLDTIDGGDGNDTLSAALATGLTSGITINLGGAVGQDIISNIENAIGTAFADTLQGSVGNNQLEGGAGDDVYIYNVGFGSDTIIDSAGSDRLDIVGSQWNDFVSVTYSGGPALSAVAGGAILGVELVTLDLGLNMGPPPGSPPPMGFNLDTLSYAGSIFDVTATLGFSASGFTGAILGVENLTGGSGNDTLIGDGSFNILNGGDGNDTLWAGDGLAGDFDTIDGGDGIDTLSAAGLAGGAFVDLFGGPGFDAISNVENAIGSAFDDTLRGSFLANNLQGGDGNDTYIYRNFGDADTVVDSAGALDVLQIVGNDFDDILNVFWSGTGVITEVNGGSASGIESVTLDLGANGFGGHADWLIYTPSTNADVTVDLAANTASGFTSIAGVESVSGGAGNDTLTGTSGNNKIDGGNGNDWIRSGDGNDIIDGGGGTDTFDVSQDFGAHHIALGNPFPMGFDTVFNIENVIGSAGDDIILGDFFANDLNGGGGNDVLSGGANADTLTGGAGNDTFRWSNGDQQFPVIVDTITDFDAAPSTDRLELTDLLQGEHANSASLVNYLNFVYTGTATEIRIDTHGFGGGISQQINLTGVDFTANNTLTQTQILDNLLTAGKLLIDA
ncbi:MAG TPA: type I secretion C-terminal target domain-containing protein [Burkholderiales bacterium]|nr:type I secretion C-terminal target domain-containing protein [Burkholderiales bacterium]